MKILTGSHLFFSNYPDFWSKDIDYIKFCDEKPSRPCRNVAKKGEDLFLMAKIPKNNYIRFFLGKPNGMCICFFLTPEVAKEINLTTEDLPRLAPMLKKLDSKHKYLEIIYNAYLENGSFTLTQEQRDEAYKSYRLSRGFTFNEEDYL